MVEVPEHRRENIEKGWQRQIASVNEKLDSWKSSLKQQDSQTLSSDIEKVHSIIDKLANGNLNSFQSMENNEISTLNEFVKKLGLMIKQQPANEQKSLNLSLWLLNKKFGIPPEKVKQKLFGSPTFVKDMDGMSSNAMLMTSFDGKELKIINQGAALSLYHESESPMVSALMNLEELFHMTQGARRKRIELRKELFSNPLFGQILTNEAVRRYLSVVAPKVPFDTLIISPQFKQVVGTATGLDITPLQQDMRKMSSHLIDLNMIGEGHAKLNIEQVGDVLSDEADQRTAKLILPLTNLILTIRQIKERNNPENYEGIGLVRLLMDAYPKEFEKKITEIVNNPEKLDQLVKEAHQILKSR